MILVVVGLLGMAAWTLVDAATSIDEPTWTADRSELSLTESRLDQIVTEVHDVGVPQGSGDPASYRGCAIDSGSVFQPAASATWAAAPDDVGATAERIVAALHAQGWIGTRSPGATTELHRSFGAWSAHAYLDEITEGDAPRVGFEATVVGAHPCRVA